MRKYFYNNLNDLRIFERMHIVYFSKKIEIRESEAKLFFKNDDGKEEEANTSHNDNQKDVTLEENNEISINVESTSITDKVNTEDVDAKANDIKIENKNDTIEKDEDYLDELVAIGRTDVINKEIPRLTGDAFIDLDSDCSTPAMVSGAQELFDRFIKQTKIHKPRTTAQLE